ncbi:MAG TPA: deoxynucleoside kinase [Candidatus Baltobacteraceae bacterium]|jgi:thymidylate kinase|nr:deoxynucleoside kinase [Candidatus Baltobacteraceae bacterium]
MKLVSDQERHRIALEALRLPPFAGRDSGRPLVVALEGANGAGKTTLCSLLSDSLAAPACLGTDEAWFSDSFKTRMIRDAEWFASAMFFLSGCFEQMRILRGWPNPLIIMDRSIWSTLAVHGAESSERLEALLAMLRPVAAQIHVPDLTLVLEASFDTCQSRIARKSGTARLLDELTAVSTFHEREEAFYRWLARQRSEVLFLDANHVGPEKIAERASEVIRERARAQNLVLPNGGNGAGAGAVS